MATYTRMLLESPTLRASYDVVHLDTADRRSVENMGRLELTNVWLAVRHIAQLAWRIVRRRPDVVYLPIAQNVWGYVRDAALMAVSRLLGRPIATHLHGSALRGFYERSGPLVRWLVRSTSRRVAAAAVLGEGLRRIYAGLVPAGRVHVVPNGIEDPFPDGAPASAAAEPDAGRRVTVTYLGTLTRRKGILELIAAAARLDAEASAPAPRFRVAGGWASDRLKAEALEAVEREGLGGRVEFVGVVAGAGKERLWRQTDIFVFPGYQPEGLPLVVLEAMAAAVPVVSTAKGAIPDAVVPEETGLLVPDRDAAALAAAIRRLAGSAAERERLGRAGRERFLDRFTADRGVARLVAMLDAACGAGALRREGRGRGAAAAAVDGAGGDDRRVEDAGKPGRTF